MVLALVAGVLYCLYLFRGAFGVSSPTVDQESTGRANSGSRSTRISWQTVDRSADGFKVQMPAGATELQVPAFTSNGSKEPVEMLQSSLDSNVTYAVAWAENPPVERASSDGAERTLDLARDGALARTQAMLTGETRSNRNGYPERDFSGQNAGGGVLNARLILAGSRLYMLIASFPSSRARHEDDVNHFFDSFSLAGAPGN